MKIFMFQGQQRNPDDPMIRAMWQKEYQHLNKCTHPNIVRREGAGRFKYGFGISTKNKQLFYAHFLQV